MDYLKMYIVALLIFLAIDFLWLGLIARTFYQNQIGHLMAERVNWVAAIVFYLLFVVGLVYFVLAPSLEAESILRAFLVGGFFGFIAYATYDLTNLATLKDWPVLVTIVDLFWGAFLGSLTSGLSYIVIHYFIS